MSDRLLRFEYIFICLVMLIGLSVSAILSWSFQNSWKENMRAGFTKLAQDRIELVNRELAENNIVLHSVVSFFQSSKTVESREFEQFTAQILNDHPYVRGVSFMPMVKDNERAAFERNAARIYQGFRIKELDEKGDLVPAPKRDEYFPIYFSHSREQNHKYAGFNYASESTRRAALEEARAKNEIVATGKIVFLNDPATAGVAFAAPIFSRNEEGREFMGYVSDALPLHDMIASALEPLSVADMNIVLSDLSMPEDRKIIYVHSTRLRKVPDADIVADYQSGRNLSENKVLDVGGRSWQITVQASRSAYEDRLQPISAAIMLIGTLFTLLLTFYLFSRIKENERINQEVDMRTRELAHTKKQVETVLYSAKEGILGLSNDGTVIFSNPAAASLLGYNKYELIGRQYHDLFHHKKRDGSPCSQQESQLFGAIVAGESHAAHDDVFWKKDGTQIEVEYTAAPIIEDGSLNGCVLVFRDVSERRVIERKLEQLARYDQLTGLANRSLFFDHVRMSVLRAQRSGRKIGIVYIDLNDFKPINDTLGHAAGDAFLVGFADRLRQTVRETDLPARIGGDEFTILADDLNTQEECVKLIERLLKNMQEPFMIKGHSFTLSASIGVAFFPDDSRDVEVLLNHADSAMYAAKKNKDLDYVLYARSGDLPPPEKSAKKSSRKA